MKTVNNYNIRDNSDKFIYIDIHIPKSYHSTWNALDDLFGDAGKNLWVLGGEGREDLAVKGEAGLFEFIDEGGVGRVAVVADGGIESDYPELAEVGLFVAAVGEGVAARAHQGLVRVALLFRTDTAVALGSLQNILAALLRHHTPLNSSHKL